MPFLVHSVGRAATSIELARVCMLSCCKPRHSIGYDKNNYRETDGYPSILAFFVGRLEVSDTSLFLPCIAVFLKSEVYELEYEASPDVRPRVREPVVRVRVRQAALRPVVRVPTNVQELHTFCHFGYVLFYVSQDISFGSTCDRVLRSYTRAFNPHFCFFRCSI